MLNKAEIETLNFDKKLNFFNGLAIVGIDDPIGIINTKGELSGGTWFQNAENFTKIN